MDFSEGNTVLLNALPKRRKEPILELFSRIPDAIRPKLRKSMKVDGLRTLLQAFVLSNPHINLAQVSEHRPAEQQHPLAEEKQPEITPIILLEAMSSVKYSGGGVSHESAVLDVFKGLGITELPKGHITTLKDGIFYETHPNGGQCFPDIRLVRMVDGYAKAIDIECKTGKNMISWNDGYPVAGAIYIFTCKSGSTIVFNGEDLIDDGIKIHEFLQEAKREANQAAKEMAATLETRFAHGLRNSITSQSRIDEIPRNVEKTMGLLADFCGGQPPITERAISLFSGAGGDTLGMEMVGVKVVGYVEKDVAASATHTLNFPHSHKIGSDINAVPDATFLAYRGRIDYLFGGFPCQSFSHAGKKKADDPLYLQFVRATNLIAPKWVIGENVKGIIDRAKEDKSMADVVVDAFAEIGYTMEYTLVNAFDFGIPQNRKRVIFIGRRQDIPPRPIVFQKKHAVPLSAVLEFSLESAAKLDERHAALTASIPLNNWLVAPVANGNNVTGSPPANLIKSLSMATADDNITYKKRSKSTYSCAVDFGDTSCSLICTYAHMPRLFVPVAVGEDRYLRPYTLLECKRIQGFPDDFKFTCCLSKAIKQIGNAICPAIVAEVIRLLR
jgi:DNA (cytosine-5)-methyltransferase 1